jgi:hypothetical protein
MRFREPGNGANKNRKIRMMRMANTAATNRHGIGGLEKTKAHTPRPITLVRMPWDDQPKGESHDRD